MAIISDSCYSGQWLEVFYQRNWLNKGIQVFVFVTRVIYMVGVEEKEVNMLLLHLQTKIGNNSMLNKIKKYLFGILDDLFISISCFIFLFPSKSSFITIL